MQQTPDKNQNKKLSKPLKFELKKHLTGKKKFYYSSGLRNGSEDKICLQSAEFGTGEKHSSIRRLELGKLLKQSS